MIKDDRLEQIIQGDRGKERQEFENEKRHIIRSKMEINEREEFLKYVKKQTPIFSEKFFKTCENIKFENLSDLKQWASLFHNTKMHEKLKSLNLTLSSNFE